MAEIKSEKVSSRYDAQLWMKITEFEQTGIDECVSGFVRLIARDLVATQQLLYKEGVKLNPTSSYLLTFYETPLSVFARIAHMDIPEVSLISLARELSLA